MRPVVFVQNNLVERLTAPVAIWARKLDLHIIDVSSTENLVVDEIGIDWAEHHPVLIFGSIQFLRKCKSSKLRPYLFHDEVDFANTSSTRKLKASALNSDGLLLLADAVGPYLASHGSHHVRPERVDKAFAGQVVDDHAWNVLFEQRQLQKDLACWVSPPQSIFAEWRCWIVGGRVVEMSQYRANDAMLVRRETAQEIHSAAQQLANLHLPVPCVVMDIALTLTGFKVVEYNPIHSSGWYAANVETVLNPFLFSMWHSVVN